MGHPAPSREGVRRSNHGRSFDRRDVWVGLKPTARLRTSRGRRCEKSTKANKTTLRSEGRSTLKKNLTGPTLLEMSGNARGLIKQVESLRDESCPSPGSNRQGARMAASPVSRLPC